MARHIAANFLNLLVVGLVLLGAFALWAQKELTREGPLGAPVVFEVPRGASFEPVADALADLGAIRSASLFRIAARYQGQDQALKFGEYEIPAGASMNEVLAVITSGRGILYQVTIPEGFTSYQIVERLMADPNLTGEIAALPPEGSLAPNTYAYNRGDSRESVIRRMEAAQSVALAAAWDNRAEGLPLSSPQEALILASIIEKETGVAGERAEVAAVFINRLNRGMKLQTDPTVIYGLTEGKGSLGRGLLRSELARPTPYNTYVIEGLPPTPIANPGQAAIEAALNPAQSDYLYFVADGSGGHAFARTLVEHNANVAKWRRIEAERRAAQEEAAAEE